MAKMIQNNFSGGCLSPSLYGRSDLAAYYKGCAKAENFVVSKEGTLRKRHGVKSVCEMPASFASSKVVPYLYDRTEAGFVVLSASGTTLTCRFYGKDCALKSTATVSAFSGDVKAIQSKQIGDQLWITNGSFFKILTVTDNQTVSARSWSQVGKPDKPSLSCTGWNADDKAYTVGIDVYYCAFVVQDGVMSALAKDKAIQKKTWEAGAYTECTVTVTKAQLDTMDYVVVGKSLGGATSYGELTRYYKEDFGAVYNGKATLTFTDKNISPGDYSYSQTNVLGEGFANPVCVDCFQQRRVFANATSDGAEYPMTLWFSEVGNLDNFYADRPTAEDDAFSPTICSTGPSFIRWIVSYQEMMVLFTDAGLFTVGFSQTQGFGPSTCRVCRFSNLSVSPDVQPLVTDAGVVFVGADNKTVYTAAYDLQENMIKPVNRSVLVEHLTRRAAIRALALQVSPDNVVWAALGNGRLATFTFERNEEVYAWSDGYVDGAEVLDVVALGSVTDTTDDAGSAERTYGDLVFVVRKDGKEYLCRNSAGWADEIGGEARPVVATLETLRPESQERTVVGQKKNVKDILLRLYETGSLAAKPTSGGANVPLVKAKTGAGTDALFTGEVKVMPRGHVNEDGRMTFVSDDARPCEILQIVTTMEVD